MTSLTILSIMRNSKGYLDRYFQQIASLTKQFSMVQIIIVEGDSDDGTKQQLQNVALNSEFWQLSVITLDMHTPHYGSISHPDRWHNLETCWNKCMDVLKLLPITDYVACIESDLIWTPGVLLECVDNLTLGYDVLCPMLFGQGVFHDTNGFRLKTGERFRNHPPIIPNWNHQRFVELATGGGMLVMRYATALKGVWRDECRLHFPDEIKLATDTELRIYHP